MDRFILKPFNGAYILTFSVYLVFWTAMYFILRKKETEKRAKFVAWSMIVTLIGFIVYKYFISIDEAYSVICYEAGKGAFNWWGELPLHLCNVNTILIPVGIFGKKKGLLNYCTYCGPLGALMALVMPAIGFSGYSMFLPRVIGYYFTHWMVFFGSLAIGIMNIQRPKKKDIWKTVLIIIVITTVIFGINMFLRLTHIYDNANYFYTVVTEGNPILEIFHRFIPVSYFYILPCLLILIPYLYLVAWLYKLADSRKKA